MRIRIAVFLILALSLLTSSSTLGEGMLQSLSRTNPTFPGVGIKVSLNLGSRPIQYVHYSDHYYMMHGWVSEGNWSSLGSEVQNAFLDPAQTNFTLETNATQFEYPPMTQFTYYNSTADTMSTLFWFQFSPGDLNPGAYSFRGRWYLAAAANPPEYISDYAENTITLVVETQTFVSCSPNPVSIGQLVNCTAAVSGYDPTGGVVWITSSTTGSFSSPNSTLSNGTCTTRYSDNFTGYEMITAIYSGDAFNNACNGSTILTVFINLTAGTNVTVQPANNLQLTFANVTVAGVVTANEMPTVPPPAPPLNSTVGPYCDVKVAAGYSGNVTVSLSFNGLNMTEQQKSNLRMMQYTPLTPDVSGTTPGVPDGTVNMRDIAYIILHFATNPNSTNWDPRCDIYGPIGAPDGVVNMRDIAFAVLCFNQVSFWIDITSHVDTTNNIVYGQTTHFSFIGIH